MAQLPGDGDHGHGAVRRVAYRARVRLQWEPRLCENLNPIEPPQTESYHLPADLAGNAITWLRKHEAFAPDRPFFMYWASGAAHSPHHVFKELGGQAPWEVRRRPGQLSGVRPAKATGWIPDAELISRADTMQGWDDDRRPPRRCLAAPS